MKKTLMFLSFAVTGLLLAFTSPIKKADSFKVDIQKSNIEWIGRKVLGEHNGDLKLSSGVIHTLADVPNSGSFVIDMKSITNSDLEDEGYNQKLINHLSSDDFFSIKKNPTANFQATKIASTGIGKLNIEGKLTIKGIENKISFPATYQLKGNTLTAIASGVKVDRTKYSIKYGSNNFFQGLGDKAIDNDFELNITLVAVK